MEELQAKCSFKKSCSVIGIALFLLMAITQGVSLFASLFIQRVSPDFFTKPYAVWLLSYIPLYLVAVPIFALVVRTLPSTLGAREKIKLPSSTFIKWLMISFSAMWIFNIVSVILTTLIGLVRGADVINPIMQVQQSSGVVWNILFGVLVAPVGEEIIFRGVMFKKLGGYGDKVYIFLSAFCFALFHANLSQFFYAFALGAIFAYVTARTGTVIYSILMHIIINAWGMVIAPLALQYGLLSVAGTLLVSVAVFGFFMFYRTVKAKRIIMTEPECEVTQAPIATALLNPSMLSFIVLCSVFVVYITFFA